MRPYAKLISLLVLTLLLVLWYDYRDWFIPAVPDDVALVEQPRAQEVVGQQGTDSIAKGAEQTCCDSLGRDTTSQRILFFGDSMVEGLSRRMCDYAMENGDTLMTVCWYGSDSEKWATTDSLQRYIRQFRPTYIVVTLCGNEQFVRDLPRREAYLRQIVSRIEHVPYVWIATPSWKADTGINAVIRRLVGEQRFFDSTLLTFTRGKDHIHPTFGSAERWMDSVAVWMESPEREHAIRMQRPVVKRKRHWLQKVILNS